jgi:hypothetical protein
MDVGAPARGIELGQGPSRMVADFLVHPPYLTQA